jgi:hypothetical protein
MRHAKLYIDEPLSVDLGNTIYALDSTAIDLCLSLFPWARFRRTKARNQAPHAAGHPREHSLLH